jgi:enoyl-CoA hydratase/carnithine racemase
VLRERSDGPVRWLTFDRPERLNSFKVADQHDLRVALEHAGADDDVRVVVLTGTGRAFSVGADRSLLDGSAPPDERSRASDEFDSVLEVLRGFDKPLVAAVNGLSIGFGCTVLLYCDLVLAAESARFRLPFTALGLVPEAGSSVLLPARGRWDDAMWAMLSSDWIGAAAAREMGLAWRVVPDTALPEEAAAVAGTIAALDPVAVRATKRLMTAGRAEAARLAWDREMVEMGRLAEGRREAGG